MKKQKKKNIGNAVLFAAAGIALTVAGLAFIPPLIEKYGNKLYKASLRNDEIDFENMGPEVVPHKAITEEEE